MLFQEPVVVQGSDVLFQKKIVNGSDMLAQEPVVVYGSVVLVSRTSFYLCL
jgi:hypothetical protein